MIKPDFTSMTKSELKAYVLDHRDDDEAFHALMDKINASPGIEVRSVEHLAELIKAKLKARSQE